MVELNPFMQRALDLGDEASANGEVPVGAVIVRDGQIIAQTRNAMRGLADPTAHAEMLAIKKALAVTGQERLTDCDLYVTLEPCTMCAGAIAHARLRRVYFAVEDEKGGAVENGVRFFASPTCHHKPEVISGLGEERARAQLTSFFAARR